MGGGVAGGNRWDPGFFERAEEGAPRCHEVPATLTPRAARRALAGALCEIAQVSAATERLSRPGYDKDSILGIRFDLFDRSDYVVHELKADRVRAIGTIQRQAPNSVLALQDNCFVFHGLPRQMKVGYIANE